MECSMESIWNAPWNPYGMLHGIHMECSMESIWNSPWNLDLISLEIPWNPYGIHMDWFMECPWNSSFHRHSIWNPQWVWASGNGHLALAVFRGCPRTSWVLMWNGKMAGDPAKI